MIQTNQNYIFYFKSTTTNNSFKVLAPQNHFNKNEIIKLKDEHYQMLYSCPQQDINRVIDNVIDNIETIMYEEVKCAMDNGLYDGYEIITVSIHVFDEINRLLKIIRENQNFPR